MKKTKTNQKAQEKNKIIANQLPKNINNNFSTENNEDLNLEYLNNLNFLNQTKQSSTIDSEYRKKLDNRMDILMGKIDENISNFKYDELNTIMSNYKNNSLNENLNIKTKEKKNNNNYINISNELNKKHKILESNKEESEKDNEEINMNKSTVFPTKVQLICKRDNEINNKLLKRCKILENETNYLKFKLNKVEKQKEFLQNIIIQNKQINKSIFDIFLVEYYKKIALDWKNVSDQLIDELIYDEIYEFTNIKLKLRNIEREKERKEQREQKEIGNNNKLSPIEIEEFILFNENLQGIKKVIRSVKESEKDLCKKYKVKINNFKKK